MPGVTTARHRLVLARAEHKFAVAHMTVFPDGSKERLHGHNYTVEIALEVDGVELASMLPFQPIKEAVAALCAHWKEHVLVAARCPYLVLLRDDTELELTLCGERYVFPRGDVLLLPIDNISVEALAAHVAELLRPAFAVPHVRAFEVGIYENPGQGATCALTL